MALQIIEHLLSELNVEEIRYCHWKSNEHLDAAVNGDTDLDMLFDKSQEDKVIELLEKNRFFLFEAVWYKKYKGIVDYIGFDETSGKIVHVHTHFNLDLGETGIKSYRLPWEDLVLENRIFERSHNIFTSSPEVEYLLLIVRTAFKYDLSNKMANKKNGRHFETEAQWLHSRINSAQLLQLSVRVLGKSMTNLIEQISHTALYNENHLMVLKKQLKVHFAQNRILSASKVNYLKLIHFVERVRHKLATLFHLTYRPAKRKLPHKGIILSLMGSDGAGKSTQTRELIKELGKKVDVLFMYMGSGDGAKSFQRRMIEGLIKVGSTINRSRKATNKNKTRHEAGAEKKDISHYNIVKQFIFSINAISLAYEKRRRLRRIENERNRGVIVVCDRYPQTNTLGYNDGPKLYGNINSRNFILRSMAGYEFASYELAKQIYPDLVIKLIGSLEILHGRRPEMSVEQINKKQNGIINLSFALPTEVMTIDIDKPVQEIKGTILNALSNQIHKRLTCIKK